MRCLYFEVEVSIAGTCLPFFAPNSSDAIMTELAMESPPLPSVTTHEEPATVEDIPYFVDNKFLKSSTTKFFDVHDPATNYLISRVPQSTNEELTAALASAEKAFPLWRAKSVMARQQIMFKFVALLRENMDRLAARITREQGKTFADAKGDVLRGLQVAEAACAAPEFLKGEVLEVAKDMETRTYREPLGVVAAVCPFSMSFTARLALIWVSTLLQKVC